MRTASQIQDEASQQDLVVVTKQAWDDMRARARITPAEFRAGRKRTTNNDLTLEEAKLNAALGLGEAGEVQNIIKKELFHGHAVDGPSVLDEIGDILFYIDWELELYGYTMEDAMEFNRTKLENRYPDKFSSERSINR